MAETELGAWVYDQDFDDKVNDTSYKEDMWENLNALPMASELSEDDKLRVGLMGGNFYERLSVLVEPLFTQEGNEAEVGSMFNSLEKLADKDIPAAELIYARARSVLAKENPAGWFIADRYFEQVYENPLTSSMMKEQVEKDKQVHEERFNQTFPNLRMEKEARDFSEEERAQIAAAIAVFTDAAKNGDLDAFKRLRTLAFRGYHQAQWGCATIALAQGNKEVGLGYMNMLKNNTCEDISVEQDKESKQDAAALVLRRERAKELSGDEQAEEMAKIDEEVRMRFGKLPFDQYKADDVVALRELAENGSAPAQEAMWGYYVHKGDTVEAEQMSGMLKQNSSAHWEGNLGNSDSYKNLDEITAEVERQKKENQGMDTANMSNDLSNADPSTIENRVKDNEQENTIETAPKNQTSLASKPATVLEPSKDEIKTIQPPPPAKAKVDDDAANAAAVARKNKRGSAGNG